MGQLVDGLKPMGGRGRGTYRMGISPINESSFVPELGMALRPHWPQGEGGKGMGAGEGVA